MKIYEARKGLFITKCGRVFKESSYSLRGPKGRRYLFVVVSPKKRMDIHRLMAETFLPKVEGKKWVLHADDNPFNNTIENLRWGTPKENSADAKKNGRFICGPRAERVLARRAKREKRDREIAERRHAGERSTDLAKEYGISLGYVSYIYKKIFPVK